MNMKTDKETLARIHDSILQNEDVQLYLRVANGQALYNDAIDIRKLIESENAK